MVFIMNLEKLEVGMVVRNYNVLCELLDENVKGGKTKVVQHKQFESHFKFEKMGHKYKILEIYNEPLKVIDNRDTGNHTIYQMHLQLLLLDNLARKASELEDDFQIMELTNQKIIKITEMANDRYLKRKNDYLLNECNISEFHINDFHRNAGIKFCRIIGSALKNLKSRCILDVTDQYKICEDNEWRTATKYEVSIITKAKYQALRKMGLKTEIQVRMKFKMPEFYKIVDGILFNEQNWSGCYKYYEVCFLKDSLNEKIEHYKIEIEEEKKKQTSELNDKIVVCFNKDAENRYNKNMNKIKELEDNVLYASEEDKTEAENAYSKQFKYNDTFVEDMKYIIKYFIPIY